MDSIHFKVNGVEHTVGCEVSADVTLLDYLRKWLGLRGTKYMCQEAGCGVCIVSVVKCPGGPHEGVNACMVLVTSCHGWEVTTIEKVGNRLEGYHPLQKCLYENNGSQCGYCSPGWVMSMYSLLKKKQRMTMLEIEKSLASNVCRCTGYRPILEAFKKFASDSPEPYVTDIEELSICSKTGEACSQTCEDYDWCVVRNEDVKPPIFLHIKLSDGRDWYRVEETEDIFKIFDLHPSQTYRLIGGNTAKGAYPLREYPRVLVDISSVSALKGHYLQQNLVVGAGNTLTELEDILLTMSQHDDFRYLRVLWDHLQLVAHIPVKNVGTIAGNLMIKNRHNEFNSDIFLLLNTVGASVGILQRLGVVVRFSMEAFMKLDMDGKVLYNIFLPPLSDEFAKVVTFKIMPRSQNAHPIVHAGYLYRLNSESRVLDCRVAYGGLSADFIRAFKTERSLIGRNLFENATLQSALRALDEEMVVLEDDPPQMSAEYRRRLALGLLYKGLLSLCPVNIVAPRFRSGKIRLRESRSLSEGSQVFETNPKLWPLNKPSPKFDGLIQCAGEASYSEDLPTQPKEVFASFVLATVALGTIQHIDATEALKEPGVIAFYKASDIPGVNSFIPAVSQFYRANEEVLCDREVKYFNQALGIIVAETQYIADRVASLVKVTYTDVKKPLLDIKLAKRDPTRITLFTSFEATKTGTDVAKVIRGEMTIYGQYHFCTETLVCVSHPTEEGIKLYSSTQGIDSVQRLVERALKIKQNQIDVFVRRLGGTFGLKISRSTQVAVACALVTHKLNKPCRFIQSLRNNMRHVGKRFPASVDFEIAVNGEGKIQHIKCQLFEDNGYIVDENITFLAANAYYNCYDKAPWDYKLFDATTDTPSNTWCRSPGNLEAISMAELVMERIAYEMKVDPLQVRLANVDRANHGEIIELVDTLKKNSQYDERRRQIDKFNSDNRWKKKGLRHAFLRWTPIGDLILNVTVSVYADDGTVVVTHGGIEMGQGVNTKAAQICAYCLNIPVEKIEIKPNDTTITPNCSQSIGSLTSEFVGIGIVKCCRQLMQNLAPISQKMPNATWEEIIKAAAAAELDLTSRATTGKADIQDYNIYGVTLAEVEIDVLTGEWNIERVDLIEDVGRSVNPEIDVGQVEGAFIMGCGYWTSEELSFSPAGEMLTDRSWHYYVPQARDIPRDFRIYFRKKSFSNEYILGSKATGEPATCMGVVIPITMREAIVEARKELGLPASKWFDIDGPFTVAKICLACASNVEDFKFY